MEKNKKLNSHALYNNNRSFFPLNIFSPNHFANKDSEKNFITKNLENSKNNTLKINNSINNLFDIDDYYHNFIFGKNNFKGSKITSKDYFKYLQRTQNKQLNFHNLKSLRLFFDKSNKYKIDSINGIPNVKVIKTRKKDTYLNRSCSQINKVSKKNIDKYSDNHERKNNNEKIDNSSYLEIEKNFANNSDIYKIEYIKKIIRKHYFENFDNLKDYFMIMSGKERYITIDDIIFYLKEIIKVNLDKREIRQLLYTNGIIKVDFNNFKFIFFPEMRNNKIVSLRLKNEKCNLLKKEMNVNIANLKKANTLKTVNIVNENIIRPQYIRKETGKDIINKSSREIIRVFPNLEIKKKLKCRELNSKMRFFLIDVNKDYIIKRFNAKYEVSDKKFPRLKQLYNFNIIKDANKNKKFDGLKNLKKIINSKINEKNNASMKASKSYNNLNKNNLKLMILKLNDIDINKIEEKLKTSSTNTSNCKDIKYFKVEDNSNYRRYKSNFISLNHKSLNSSRYLRNDLKNDLTKMAEYSTCNVNKLNSFYINKSKEKRENRTKETRIQKNEILNQDSNASKTFLFFKNDFDDIKSKELSISINNQTQIEKETKINKNSDILDFL